MDGGGRATQETKAKILYMSTLDAAIGQVSGNMDS